MRVLVTGGAGFIGSHVCDLLLERGHEVRVLDNLDSQVHPDHGWPAYMSWDVERWCGDVRDERVVKGALADADVLIHLAAAVGVGQSMYEILRYTSVNTLGAATLLEHARGLQKMVVASSMSIYGEGAYNDAGKSIPTPESHPLKPASIYAINKRDHEEMFLVTGAAYGVPTTALRFFNVYGPRQALSNPYTGVAAIFASRLMNRTMPVIFEDGQQTRDFVHVSDVARAVVAVVESPGADGLAVNVGTGRATTVLDAASTLCEVMNVWTGFHFAKTKRAGDIRHCVADISLAGRSLGYEPRVNFRDGMMELVDWLRFQPTPRDGVYHALEELQLRGLA